jgi:DNA-binding response OmpR family regulator
MPEILLLIPDVPLCNAVIEQIKAANLGVPRPVDSIQAILKHTNESASHILIIDRDAFENKKEDLAKVMEETSDKPVVLVLGEAEDEAGATETFSKPFRLGHLISRLKYYLETAPLLRNRAIGFGPYRLEPLDRRVVRESDSEPIRLTEKETALLVFLAQNKTPAARQDILANVWGYDERIDTHTLETHIYQLRRKLDREGENWLVNNEGTYCLAEIKE